MNEIGSVLGENSVNKYRYEAEEILLSRGFDKVRYVDDPDVDFKVLDTRKNRTLHIKLKTRACIRAENKGRDLWVMFPDNGRWYLTPHDVLIDVFDQGSTWRKPLKSVSWLEHEISNRGGLSQKMQSLLDEYRL